MCIENSCPRIMAKHDGAVDPSLVKTCKRSKEVHRQYRLGMGSWTESSSEDEKEILPPNGLSLKLKKPPCKRSKEVHRQNPLGMGSWTESSIEDEKRNLPPNGKSLKPSHRWSFITNQDKEELSERHVPKNTEATTKWVLANFNAWRQGRNEAFACDPNQQVPSDLLQFTDDAALSSIKAHSLPCHSLPCHSLPCHSLPCHSLPCHSLPCHSLPF